MVWATPTNLRWHFRGESPAELEHQLNTLIQTNVTGNIHLYNQFMPQILKGQVKKVVVISSGMGDMDFARDYDISESPLYSISKAGVNMVSAKFSAQYKKDGVLFLSICPGMVDVGHYEGGKHIILGALSFPTHPTHPTDQPPPPIVNLAEHPGVVKMVDKFKRYSPTFKGPDTPPESIKAVLSVVENSSIESGAGGAYLSHFGTKRWI